MAESVSRRRVRRLSDTLANQIAAGEVVERPASVLKELLENALDSGAARIDVDAQGGGARLVRVRDDGAGIHRDDLLLALERHATSKIAVFSDLIAVRTMGFRGEALPSIASVARLEIDSHAAGGESGWRVQVEGGALDGDPEPTGHPVGTTVSVRDLFYNTPARRKFLRTERTELRHLEDVARRVALAHPEIGFTLRHDERTLFQVPAARDAESRARRLGTLCGRAFAAHAAVVDVAATGLALRGWVAEPGADRAHADLQFFFVNGRPVSDQVARHAIRTGLGDAVAAGRHPAYVLFLEVDPAEVDVNVHPAKHEVRYREARLVHDFVQRALSRGTASAVAFSGHGDTMAGSGQARRAQGAFATPGAGARPGRAAVAEALAGYARLAGAPPPDTGAARVAGGRFLALPDAGGLAIVDVARARRAWLALRADGADENAPRPLLVPVSAQADERAAERIEARGEALGATGIDVRRVAPGAVALRRVPVLLERVRPEALLDAVLRVAGAAGAPTSAVALRDGVLDLLDLVEDWRDESGDTARMLGVVDRLAETPGVRALLDAEALARLTGRGR